MYHDFSSTPAAYVDDSGDVQVPWVAPADTEILQRMRKTMARMKAVDKRKNPDDVPTDSPRRRKRKARLQVMIEAKREKRRMKRKAERQAQKFARKLGANSSQKQETGPTVEPDA